mmetsp:Transcript_4272/g.6040  ORF Transcript_4272/g.6040 Transcript_4272/m.6040 type:complete len:276 (+) Transcript_4272:79-906(+)|eukprot:CAMPEP_0197318054 /NCGR_PEP_ID=MMETSP0891-20130614/49353_1 /TAXON_ID=44058 ORGANISM="Aureoumbra lagunensis, Strain CCMP1510" /NCGR_SAMPLE_ID=MMETSP0891 /ASSEMBLY_ACC=CAM_ASM_000534 /LENGTH=275 /DNA_ID=CAMNT_0042808313 /DNA_START=39 /DNA_END=866 /DNA_ORIENTATION=-
MSRKGGFPLRSIPEDGDAWSPSREKVEEVCAPSVAEKLAAREALKRMDKALKESTKVKENVAPENIVPTTKRGGSWSSSSSEDEESWGDDANGQRLTTIDAAHVNRTTTKKGPRRRQTIISLLRMSSNSSDSSKSIKKSHQKKPPIIAQIDHDKRNNTHNVATETKGAKIYQDVILPSTTVDYETVVEISDDVASLDKDAFDKARSLHERLNQARRSLAEVERFLPTDALNGCGGTVDAQCTVVDCIYASSCDGFDEPEEVQPSWCDVGNNCALM